MQFNFKIKYKLKESNPINRPSQQLDFAKGFETKNSK